MADTKYFVEFLTDFGKWATFHGFYDTATAAMDAGQRNLIDGALFRVIAFEPRTTAECISGMWRNHDKCKFCGDVRALDKNGHCAVCLEGMYRSKGD